MGSGEAFAYSATAKSEIDREIFTARKQQRLGPSGHLSCSHAAAAEKPPRAEYFITEKDSRLFDISEDNARNALIKPNYLFEFHSLILSCHVKIRPNHRTFSS